MPRKRNVLMILSAGVAALGAFIGTSYATAPSSDIDPSLPAHALSKQDTSPETQAAIEALLTPDAVERFGIVADSYANIRTLAETETGAIYVLPGRTGLCVVLLPALSCGDVGGADGAVGVWVPVASGEYVVGGGVLRGGISRVTVRRQDGRTSPASLVPGGFTLGEALSLRPGERFELLLR